MGARSATALPVLTCWVCTSSWQAADLEALVRQFAEENGLGLGKVAQPLRAALTGRSVSPPVFDVLAIFGRDECLARLRDAWP